MDLRVAVNMMKAVVIAFVTVFILMVIFNFVSYRSLDPEQYIALFAYAALFIGAFLSGFLSAKLTGQNGLLCGCVAGGAYLLLIYAVSLFLGEGDTSGMARLLLYAGALATACAGGLLGAYKRPVKLSPKKARENAKKKYLSKM